MRVHTRLGRPGLQHTAGNGVRRRHRQRRRLVSNQPTNLLPLFLPSSLSTLCVCVKVIAFFTLHTNRPIKGRSCDSNGR